MRKLLWFTIGFSTACAFFACNAAQPWIGIVAAVAAGVICFVKPLVRYRRIGILLVGMAVGIFWCSVFQSRYLGTVSQLDGKTRELSITASDYGWETERGTGLDGWTVLAGRKYRVRTYLTDERPLTPGEMAEGTFYLRSTAEDAGDSYFAGFGYYLLAYQKSQLQYTVPEKLSPVYYPAYFASKIEESLESCFPEDTAAFAKALLLGKTEDLGYELETALKLSGIRHVVTVSGLHVAILFALVQLLTLKKPWLTALMGIPILGVFAALAGFSPSVTRACLMCGLMMLGRLVNKEYDGATALAFSVLVMLILNPLAITSASLQLSVSCVAGIFLFYKPFYDWFLTKLPDKERRSRRGKILRGAAASLCVTLSVMVMTTPLCAYYFGAVSLAGPLTNLVTMWVIGFVFYGIVAVCALHLVWGAGAILLARLVSVPIRYIIICAQALASFPLSSVYTKSIYITIWLIFCYVLLGAFSLFGWKSLRRMAGCVVLSLCVAVAFSWAEPLLHNVRMTVLDVGQGQSILLQSEGRTYLIDCGGSSNTRTADAVAETLMSQGINRIDGIVITHLDADHVGGLEKLLKRMDTDLLILPRRDDYMEYPAGDFERILVEEDICLQNDKSRTKIFGSGYRGAGNENSLCILFEAENCAILITGDRSELGEQLLLRRTQLPKLDVLIAGHHGAADSTGDTLLQATRPETVIISAGENNGYEHPAPELLQRLEDYGCKVYRTDLHGTIVFRR